MKKNQQYSKSSNRAGKYMDLSKDISTKTESDLFNLLESVDEPFLLILDQVQDPHNLGACLRSADAAGVHAVICPKDRSVGLTETVRSIARGAADNVPLILVTNLSRTMKQLKDAGVWLIGTSDIAPDNLYDVDLTGPIALVMGSEGKGLRRLTEEKCDRLIRIPMASSSKVECLNVSVATGVTLFEAVRQRDTNKS